MNNDVLSVRADYKPCLGKKTSCLLIVKLIDS